MPKEKTPELLRVEFSCHAPAASLVFLAGSFNDWNPAAAPMARRGDGRWEAIVQLKSGCYYYKYVIDGRWCCEPHCPPGCTGNPLCDRCVPNAYGTMDRVMVVG